MARSMWVPDKGEEGKDLHLDYMFVMTPGRHKK